MRTLIAFLLNISIVLSCLQVSAAPGIGPSKQASILLDQMTPEERVGQLFLVPLVNDENYIPEQIEGLIQTGHIAGVIIQPGEGEVFTSAEDLQIIINNLQQVEYNSSSEATILDDETGEYRRPVYIPLYVAADPDYGANALSQFTKETLFIPTPLSIGATWDTQIAYSTGEVIGQELFSMGINMFFGPALDVIEDPRLTGEGDLGVQIFGGDPFWVAEMGSSFVAGVHAGSDDGVAVIAKHFPGLGSSDRSLEEEVATVRKSLDQLKQIELPPFFAVTNATPGTSQDVVDGLLISHIRYQGFQGNIRATTRPVSLDSVAFDQLMSLEELSLWRDGGGLVISDNIGSGALRRFINSLGQVYQGYLVAKDAFLAGNDLIILSGIQGPQDDSEIDAIQTVLNFFSKKYREDSAFAQRVDISVLRILENKLHLQNGTFNISDVLRTPTHFQVLEGLPDVAVESAGAGVTLINPLEMSEVEDRLGGPPKSDERILIITDTRSTISCLTCNSEPSISVTGLESELLRLYGPRGAGIVSGWQLASISMYDLAAFLGQPISPSFSIPLMDTKDVDEAIREADWLVVLSQDQDGEVTGGTAFTEFLDKYTERLLEKKVVVFSAGVPYDLGATDISKIDVFYGLYATTAPYIEFAARLLFFETSPGGASPVSIPGVGYNLINITAPDPNQVINISLLLDNGSGVDIEGTYEAEIGNILQFAAGPILDVNGHIVPDFTPVDFKINYQAEANLHFVTQAFTSGGIAQLDYVINSPGLLTVTAASSGALASDQIIINVLEPESGIEVIPEPTASIQPTLTQESPVSTPVDSEQPPVEDPADIIDGPIGLEGLLLGMFGLLSSLIIHMYFQRERRFQRGFNLQELLSSVIGGLVAYNYLVLNMPGSEAVLRETGILAGFIFAFCGSSGVILLWAIRLNRDARTTTQ